MGIGGIGIAKKGGYFMAIDKKDAIALKPRPGIPKGIHNLGQMVLEKGGWYYGSDYDQKEFNLIAWDFASDCTGDKCPVFNRCMYLNGWEGKDRCRMQQQYFLHIIRAFASAAGKNDERVGQEDVIRFGYSLLPLYGQLFRFKLFELGNSELLTLNARGEVRINPIYKEIREIIKTIHGVWRDICQSIKPEKEKAAVPGLGDDAFIDALYCVGEKPKGKTVAPDDDGSGMDFDGEEEIPDGDGVAVDMDEYNTVEECRPVTRSNKKHALDKVDWKLKEKRRREKKAKEPKPVRKRKELKQVLSPMQKIRKRNAEERAANMEIKKNG